MIIWLSPGLTVLALFPVLLPVALGSLVGRRARAVRVRGHRIVRTRFWLAVRMVSGSEIIDRVVLVFVVEPLVE